MSKQPPTSSPSSGRKRWRSTVAELVLVLAVFLGMRAWTQRHVVEGAAPPLAGVSLTGQSLSLAAHKGQPIAVHFWGTWCPVCTAEIGTVGAVAQDHTVISVAVGSGTRADVQRWMDRHGVQFPTLLDDGVLAQNYGVRSYPTTFFIDASGRIRFVEVGYTTELGFRTRMLLAAL